MTHRRLLRLCGGTGTALALLFGSTLIGPSADAAPARAGGNLSLIAYSTPAAAYKLIIPQFQKTAAGKGVTFTQSYAASGDQSRAVASGLPADVVEFSAQPDMTRLVQAGLVDKSWNQNKYHGMVTDSIVVFVVRPGNPKHIKTWDDLIKPGVSVITPNPFQSGSAQWNLMAGYGAELAEGKKPAQAQAYLKKLLQHTAVQDTSGRNATNTWAGGKGDILLSYENEAINARNTGIKLSIVIPPQTILIENPVAVIKTSKNLAQAKAFVKFLYTKKAQWDFGNLGYRPIDKTVYKVFEWVRPSKKLFTITSLGGWDRVEPKFFDPANGIVAGIERDLGVSP
jgi:sulfate/thiosulfate transport system substrate-binding protein